MSEPRQRTPGERSLIGKIGAHALHSKIVDPVAHTKPARDAFWARFERLVDPDNALPPDERARLAAHARQEYFARLALASAKARRRKRGAA